MITISNAAQNVNFDYYLKDLNKANQKSIERLSSGYKLESASDNAGGYQTAIDATLQLRGLEVANQNAAVASEIGSIAHDQLSNIEELANSIQSLAIQALEGTTSEREALEDKANTIMSQMKSIKADTKYNDVQVFKNEGFMFQIGYEGDANSALNMNTSLAASELSGFDIDTYVVDFSSDSAIEAERQTFDDLQGDLNLKSSEIGVKNQNLDSIIENQEKIYTNVSINREKIVNTDVAKELFNYTKINILSDVTQALKQQTSGLNSSLALNLIAR